MLCKLLMAIKLTYFHHIFFSFNRYFDYQSPWEQSGDGVPVEKAVKQTSPPPPPPAAATTNTTTAEKK